MGSRTFWREPDEPSARFRPGSGLVAMPRLHRSADW